MVEDREEWSTRPAFVMAAIGSAVGLGNVWRFPYICYQNGGGAFLIPYFVALITAGIPLMILEMGIGSMMKNGAPGSLAKAGKRWEWVGWCALLAGFVVVVYYAVIIAWCFNYLIHSITLAWEGKAEHFFQQDFLGITPEPGQLGGIRVPILAGLVLTWMSIYLIIFKGVRAVGKVVMITVPLPILIILVFVIRGITLPGAIEGLKFYLTPDFSRLADPKVWLAAYGQIFFSLSLAFGIMIAYASYLPVKSDVTNNAMMIALGNCGTSFLAGFAVFSALGYLAHATGSEVSQVVTSGPGLTFVTYPMIISLLPFGASVFGVLFFILLLTLGIDSAFSLVEAAVAGGVDKWGISRERVVGFTCALGFILGVVYTTRGGLYWLDIVDHFINNFGLTFVGFVECIAIGYLFGTGKLREFMNSVSDVRIGIWWDVFIRVVTPAILATSFLLSLIERIQEPYEGYRQWMLSVGGWAVLVLILVISLLLARIPSTRR